MTAVTEVAAVRPLARVLRRTWAAVVAAWGAAVGLAPHVLHHVGALAGAALLAGAAGTALFAAIEIVAAVPFLLRLHRRFQSWYAPAAAFAVFAAMFSLSSFVIGPAIANENAPARPRPGLEQPAGHEQQQEQQAEGDHPVHRHHPHRTAQGVLPGLAHRG